MFEAELIVNFDTFDRSKYTEDKLKEEYNKKIKELRQSLINQKKQQIINKLNDNDKREYLNLASFYLT